MEIGAVAIRRLMTGVSMVKKLLVAPVSAMAVVVGGIVAGGPLEGGRLGLAK